MRFRRRWSSGRRVAGCCSRFEEGRSDLCDRAAEGSQKHCEMAVVRKLGLAGCNAGTSVLEMLNTEKVGWIVAVHMMAVPDWVELKSKRLSEPEVWCLPS